MVRNECQVWADPNPHRRHVVTDRGLYRPGETVTVKGWLRKIAKTGELKIPDTESACIAVVLNSRYQQLAVKPFSLTNHGTFDFKVGIPEQCQLGVAKIQLVHVDGAAGLRILSDVQRTGRLSAEHTATFDIQQFRYECSFLQLPYQYNK